MRRVNAIDFITARVKLAVKYINEAANGDRTPVECAREARGRLNPRDGVTVEWDGVAEVVNGGSQRFSIKAEISYSDQSFFNSMTYYLPMSRFPDGRHNRA